MQKTIPPSSSTEYHHNRHRPERLSPDRSSHEVELPRPPKRKPDHHDRDRDLDQDYAHDRHHHHRHHRSGSSSRPSSEPVTKTSSAAAATAASAAERKHKASVFSRISFPEGEVIKKRKLSSSSAEAGTASVSTAHHKAASNGYYEDYKSGSLKTVPANSAGRKSSAVPDYESSDDERHFKRRPSRYEPSPPPAQADWEEEGRHSRGSKERKHR